MPAGTNSGQIIATMLRATPGRIDKAFKVNSGLARQPVWGARWQLFTIETSCHDHRDN